MFLTKFAPTSMSIEYWTSVQMWQFQKGITPTTDTSHPCMCIFSDSLTQALSKNISCWQEFSKKHSIWAEKGFAECCAKNPIFFSFAALQWPLNILRSTSNFVCENNFASANFPPSFIKIGRNLILSTSSSCPVTFWTRLEHDVNYQSFIKSLITRRSCWNFTPC